MPDWVYVEGMVFWLRQNVANSVSTSLGVIFVHSVLSDPNLMFGLYPSLSFGL